MNWLRGLALLLLAALAGCAGPQHWYPAPDRNGLERDGSGASSM